jgi:hypothetical protein
MSPTPTNNSIPTKKASTTLPTKKARLISKDLDRSPSRVSSKSTNVQKVVKPYARQHASPKFQNKFRGGYGKKFKRAPSNYEANMKVTHGLVRTLTQKPLSLQPVSVSHPLQDNKVPTAVNEPISESTVSTLQRVTIQQYQPRKPGSCDPLRSLRVRSMRLLATYSGVRPLLADVPRARGGIRSPFYAVRAARPLL